MDSNTLTPETIDRYVQNIINETGIDQLPNDQKKPLIESLKTELNKAVTITLINALTAQDKKEFEKRLSTRDSSAIITMLIDKNPDYGSKVIKSLEEYKNKYLQAFFEELKKYSPLPPSRDGET